MRPRLLRAIRRSLARPYAREVAAASDQAGWIAFDTENFFLAMAEALWLDRARAGGWFDHWFASTGPRVEYLRSRGVDATHVPVGWHEHFGRDRGVERDIPVLYLGRFTRARSGAALLAIERRLGVPLLTVSRGCYGAEREQLLSRSRIVLNLLKMPHDFAGIRMLMSLGCGALVVSEDCPDCSPYEPNVHFVAAPHERLADAIRLHLDDEERRRAIASRGRRFVTGELTLASMVDRMLEVAAS